jgi:hypothetical protein
VQEIIRVRTEFIRWQSGRVIPVRPGRTGEKADGDANSATYADPRRADLPAQSPVRSNKTIASQYDWPADAAQLLASAPAA